MTGSFEWDEAKRQSNLVKHGVDFRRAAQLFRGRTIEVVDRRRDYGERRLICFGEIDGRVYTLVYTWRGFIRRIISARKANDEEVTKYYARDD
jgi:hypothetical protein